MLIVLLDRGSMDRGDLDFSALERVCPTWRSHDSTEEAEVADRIADATVAISNKVRLDDEALQGASRLRLICISATGTDHVDLDAAKRRGIAVCNVRGYATPSVVQHVFTLMLALSTRLPDYRRAVGEERWQRGTQFCLLDYPIHELAGKILGIVGYGELGQAVARVAEAFGMRIMVAQRPGAPAMPGRVSLRELLPQVDVLSIHCPLTPETRGLIGVKELALMRPNALLLNTARGGIVDEAALAEVLRGGRLGGAGVDVLSEEPPVHGNPLLARDVPNLIVTPHIAWASFEARQRLVDEVAENIRAFLSGEERNRVV
ncbi:MAG: 2-hydroxyacid dehydrogenase [Pseudomonadota bacterium]